MQLDALIAFFGELTESSLGRIADFYADDAYFKDPFNEVHGVDAIERIFRHMFRQVAEPRFVVTERIVEPTGAMLIWEFHYRRRGQQKGQVIRGVSHLRFDAAGKVAYHRDYWDAAEELYMKLPGLGLLMRALRRALRA